MLLRVLLAALVASAGAMEYALQSATQTSTASVISAVQYGAKGDARAITGTSMAPNTNIVQVPAPTFSRADVGKVINVIDACENNGVKSTLEGTITEVRSPTSIVVQRTPDIECSRLPGLTAGTIQFGTNNFKAIDAGILAIASSPKGGTLYLPATDGGYMCLPPTFSGARPASISINADNLTLAGDPQQTRIWTRGAYSLQNGKVTRAAGIVIAGDRRPHHDVTIRNIWLDGGTTGYTTPSQDRYPADPKTGDFWDITHAGIVGMPDTALTNIQIEDVTVSNYRGEEILFMGIKNDSIEVAHCHLYGTNADNVSISSKRLTVTDNVMEKASNACIENGLFQHDILHHIERNSCTETLYNGMIFQGVDNTAVGQHSVIIENNRLERVGTPATRTRSPSGVRISTQVGSSEVVSNVTIRANIFKDCQNGITLESVSGALIKDNTFEFDSTSANAAINLVGSNSGRGKNSLQDVLVTGNTALRTNNAVARGLTVSPMLFIGPSDPPRYQYRVRIKNMNVENNSWKNLFYDVTNYSGPDSQIAWNSLVAEDIRFRGNTCTGCIRDRNHDEQTVAAGGTVYPLNDTISVRAPDGAIVNVATDKCQDTQEVSLIAASNTELALLSDRNENLGGAEALVLKSQQSARLVFSARSRQWNLAETSGRQIPKNSILQQQRTTGDLYLCNGPSGKAIISDRACPK